MSVAKVYDIMNCGPRSQFVANGVVVSNCNLQNLTRGSKLRDSIEAPPGYVVVVRDLAQIEARMLAVVAGQLNVVEQFANGEDVYSLMASTIYGRHVDRKKNPDDFIPGFIGKAVVLGCIAKGMRVLTNVGLVPIEEITTEHTIWDGEAFVEHDGVVYQGEKACIKRGDLWATPDHMIAVPVGVRSKRNPVDYTRFDAATQYLDCAMNVQPLPPQTAYFFPRMKATYDILNCGDRNRFVVEGMVVHNCGYGLGWAKFQSMIRVGMLGMRGILFDESTATALGANIDGLTARNDISAKIEGSKPFALTLEQHRVHCACAIHIINTFRNNNPHIVNLWTAANTALDYMLGGSYYEFGQGVVVSTAKDSILMPNGMYIKYPKLAMRQGKGNRKEYSVTKRRGRGFETNKVYGGLLVENMIQGLSRTVIAHNMLQMRAEGMHVVMHTHDEIVVLAPEGDAERTYQRMGEIMSVAPGWAPSLPLASEGGWARNYSK